MNKLKQLIHCIYKSITSSKDEKHFPETITYTWINELGKPDGKFKHIKCSCGKRFNEVTI